MVTQRTAVNPSRVIAGPPDWWPVGARKKPSWAEGDDSASQDWVGRDPQLNPLMWLAYQARKPLDTADIEADFRKWFSLLGTGDTGKRIIDQFMTGGGVGLLHPSGSDLSLGLVGVSKVKNFIARVKTDIDTQLRYQRRQVGAADAKALAITCDLELSTKWGLAHLNDYSLRMIAMVGGIQGVELYVRKLRDTGPAEQVNGYSLDVRLRIRDDFGVGADDLYHGSLVSMWMLQHQRTARPFVQTIDIQFEVANKW